MPPGLSLRRLYARYALNALVIVGAGAALPAIGKALAAAMGWEHTFVGTTFLALATSVPEIVISVEAVRIGAVDLAIGNLLGSNLFDLLILGLDDLAYLEGPLFAAASPEHLFTTITALTMTGIVAAGLSYRPRARLFRLVGWVSFALLTLGLLNALVLFLLR
jgi:cation:H+ antiporter